MYLEDNGSFYGYYHDSEMGVNDEAYPDGTLYECSFSGSFSDFCKISNHEYSMVITEFQIVGNVGDQYIKDGVRHIVRDSAGLKAGDAFHLYLPGTPKSRISEECLSWIYGVTKDPIDCFILCNVTQQHGFNAGI